MGENMVEINCVEIKNIINSLRTIIEEYEIVELNIFNQLKDSCVNWQDGNSIKFGDNIILDKEEIDIFVENLNNEIDLYNYMYNNYIRLGKKIKCNMNNKDTILYLIDNCCNKAVTIINEFNRINISFYYSEQYNIFEQKNKIIKVKNDLLNIRESIKDLYNKIEQIEKNINIKIKKLEEMDIKKLDFDIN